MTKRPLINCRTGNSPRRVESRSIYINSRRNVRQRAYCDRLSSHAKARWPMSVQHHIRCGSRSLPCGLPCQHRKHTPYPRLQATPTYIMQTVTDHAPFDGPIQQPWQRQQLPLMWVCTVAAVETAIKSKCPVTPRPRPDAPARGLRRPLRRNTKRQLRAP